MLVIATLMITERLTILYTNSEMPMLAASGMPSMRAPITKAIPAV